MKKVIAVLLSILMLFSLSACSGPNAELTQENVTATVDTAMNALKSFDTEKLDKYVSSSTLAMISSYAGKHEQFTKLGRAMFSNLEYEITDINIDEKTVTLSVKNKDLSTVAYNFAQNLLANYSTLQLMTQITNDDWLDLNLTTLTDGIDSATMQDTATAITLTIKQEKKNLVLEFDETSENTISGGALSAIKTITS